jgi:uncharacterized protein with HEPN domain
MNKKDIALLDYMLEAAEYIQQHQRSECSFFTRHRAIVFELVTIGEATKSLSAETKAAYPHIPWRLIGDARNRMVHSYETISTDAVNEIITVHLPVLVSEIQKIMEGPSHG